MKTLLEQAEALRAGEAVMAKCPWCGIVERWQSTPITMRTCGFADCGFVLELPPKPYHLAVPTILCSRCGQALYPSGKAYRCDPCDRSVAP
jgi:hypothetical protein